MKEFFKLSERMPPELTYVLVRTPARPWGSINDQKGVKWSVAMLEYGLSVKQRRLNPPEFYHNADEFGNNLVGFYWRGFGQGDFNGQEVDIWAFLPDAKENKDHAPYDKPEWYND